MLCKLQNKFSASMNFIDMHGRLLCTKYSTVTDNTVINSSFFNSLQSSKSCLKTENYEDLKQRTNL